ncbi:uncharacterized protein LOC110817873 [Carica papaya]|uniref:uncharacterized protein LOC110817873 n=1 Tax=Carica papaya TaxID=3649 RepID=UPI000B8CD9D7|nr:uncharacterized protein LOC110817873 [Carica papaya]
MLFAAVSWVGYPVLRSLAILLFLTTNLMYMFMATLDDVTSETQHSREKTIQIKGLNFEINETDSELENQEATDQSTVCGDDELTETISEKSCESACQNLEDKKNEWSDRECYYENRYYYSEDYDYEDFENEFNFDRDPLSQVCLCDCFNTVSTENSDDDDHDADHDDGSNSWAESSNELVPPTWWRHMPTEADLLQAEGDDHDQDHDGDDHDADHDDGSNSWAESSNELVRPTWWLHMPTEADLLQAEGTHFSITDKIATSCQIPPLYPEEEADEDANSTIERENVFSLNSKLDATIQCLENHYRQTSVVFPRLIEASTLLLEMVTYFKEKENLFAKLESATESLEEYKQERDELSLKLSGAIAQAEFQHRVRERYEERCTKLEEERNILSWQRDAAKAISENHTACSNKLQENYSQLEEENRKLGKIISAKDSVIRDLNKVVSELNEEITYLREQMSAADGYMEYVSSAYTRAQLSAFDTDWTF